MISRPMLALVAAMSLAAGCASADEHGRHPAYVHALSDLRTAQWQLDHRRPEDGRISVDENIAHDEISAAIRDIQRAAYLDGKPVDWQPPPDVRLAPEGRLHATIDLLRKAHSDIAQEEDDPRSRPLQQHGLQHVDAALNAAQHAVQDVRYHDSRRE